MMTLVFLLCFCCYRSNQRMLAATIYSLVFPGLKMPSLYWWWFWCFFFAFASIDSMNVSCYNIFPHVSWFVTLFVILCGSLGFVKPKKILSFSRIYKSFMGSCANAHHWRTIHWPSTEVPISILGPKKRVVLDLKLLKELCMVLYLFLLAVCSRYETIIIDAICFTANSIHNTILVMKLTPYTIHFSYEV
jgi:hypothetical protein